MVSEKEISSEAVLRRVPIFEMRDIYTEEGRRIAQRRAIFTDRGEFIEVVSNQYVLIQPREVLERFVKAGFQITDLYKHGGKIIADLVFKDGDEERFLTVYNSTDRTVKFKVLFLVEVGDTTIPVKTMYIRHYGRDTDKIVSDFVHDVIEIATTKGIDTKKILLSLNDSKNVNVFRNMLLKKYFKDSKKFAENIEELKKMDNIIDMYKHMLKFFYDNKRVDWRREKAIFEFREWFLKMLKTLNVISEI